jgi:glycosyltransferase involved in cell wall biosynthesis
LPDSFFLGIGEVKLKKIDVVIPVYNGEHFILECLESVFNQSYPICHVIVVDDGSTDRTKELLTAEMQNRRNLRVIFGENRGVSAARNQGLELVDADYLALLDSDDFWLKDKIANQIRVIEGSIRPFVGVACQYFALDEQGLVNVKSRHGAVTRKQLIALESTLPGSASSVLINLQHLPLLPRFETGLNFGEDLDYWIQCAAFGEWYVSNDMDVVIRSHPAGAQISMRSEPEISLRSMRFVLNKHRRLLSSLHFHLVDGYLYCVFIKGLLKQRKPVDLNRIRNFEPHPFLKIFLGLSYFANLKLRFSWNFISRFKISI